MSSYRGPPTPSYSEAEEAENDIDERPPQPPQQPSVFERTRGMNMPPDLDNSNASIASVNNNVPRGFCEGRQPGGPGISENLDQLKESRRQLQEEKRLKTMKSRRAFGGSANDNAQHGQFLSVSEAWRSDERHKNEVYIDPEDYFSSCMEDDSDDPFDSNEEYDDVEYSRPNSDDEEAEHVYDDDDDDLWGDLSSSEPGGGDDNEKDHPLQAGEREENVTPADIQFYEEDRMMKKRVKRIVGGGAKSPGVFAHSKDSPIIDNNKEYVSYEQDQLNRAARRRRYIDLQRNKPRIKVSPMECFGCIHQGLYDGSERGAGMNECVNMIRDNFYRYRKHPLTLARFVHRKFMDNVHRFNPKLKRWKTLHILEHFKHGIGPEFDLCHKLMELDEIQRFSLENMVQAIEVQPPMPPPQAQPGGLPLVVPPPVTRKVMNQEHRRAYLETLKVWKDLNLMKPTAMFGFNPHTSMRVNGVSTMASQIQFGNATGNGKFGKKK